MSKDYDIGLQRYKEEKIRVCGKDSIPLNLIHTWSDKAFKGNVVNRAAPFLHEGSLEITLTVPLMPIYRVSHKCGVCLFND